MAVLFTTPLGMRIDEGLGGTPADIAVRIFGSDLDRLAQLGERAEAIARQVRGLEDVRAEQLTGLPQLRVTVDRAAAARVGLTPGDVIRAIRIGLVGETVSEVWVGQRRFDLVVRLQDERRRDVNAIRNLLIDGHDGTRIPLGQLATIDETFGAGPIRREAGSRRIAVEASVSGRDLGGAADELRERLDRELTLPPGYFVDVGGQGGEPGPGHPLAGAGHRPGPGGGVRAAVPGAGQRGRGGGHPGHAARRVRRAASWRC